MKRNEDSASRRGGITAFGNSVHRPEEDPSKKRKEVGEHHDGSFGVYMAHKIQKLRNQNTSFVDTTQQREGKEPEETADATAVASTTSTTQSQLFKGVHVYVDGYTTPSKEEIRGLMLLHGGGFEFYETSRVTHIIATHLATSKMLQYKKMRRPPPVVNPNWIVQSIEANKLLGVQPFLYKAFADPTQKSVALSFSLSAMATKSQQAEQQDQDQDASNKEMEGEDDDGFSESDGGGGSGEDDYETATSQYFSQQQQASLTSDNNAPASSPTAEAQAVVAPSAAATAHVTHAPRSNSTRDGPSLVRHFFAKSRLHHIGSWRATFQQRAHEFASKYKGQPFPRAPICSNDRVILHVDMDCFFVAVAVRDKPQYHDHQNEIPIAIAHSGNAGTSEISSCNYKAREKGVHARMFMQTAKELCPQLVVLPYQFDQIEQCSFQIYDIFFTHTPYVQAMSCDEAYLEFSSETDGVEMAQRIRHAIYEATQCTASVGVSYNILLAKLATKQGKPNGVFKIATAEQAEPFVESLRIKDLPGVGHRMSAKMDELGLENVAQLRGIAKHELQHHFGKTTSEMLYNYARGIDVRPLSLEANMMRKSVSAVVNFGIRFATWADVTSFMMALAEELSTRLTSLKVTTKCITLLIKKRKQDAPVEPSKFMGMGKCDSFSKSQLLADATHSDLVIGRTCLELLRQYQFPVEDLRGVGIQATKLVSLAKPMETKIGQRFRAWLVDSETTSTVAAAAAGEEEKEEEGEGTAGLGGRRRENNNEMFRYTEETLSQINMSVLEELPPEIREEVLAAHFHLQQQQEQQQQPTRVAMAGKTSNRGGLTRRGNGKQRLVNNKPPIARGLFTKQGPVNPPAQVANATSPTVLTALNDIRMSQVDDDVYRSLPHSIRKEINAYTKRSTPKKSEPRPQQARNQAEEDEQQQQQLQQKRVVLSSIEDLFAALMDVVTSERDLELISAELSDEHHAEGRSFRSEERICGAFDAIFSRILVEIDRHALDSALRMLRFVRRKCHEYQRNAGSDSRNVAAAEIRKGFNYVLDQINRELKIHYNHGVFPPQLIAPL